jgi:hypothetical protein
MRATIPIIAWILRVAVGVQLVSGILFWTGHAYTYVPFHMAVGSVVVLCLWALAVFALVMRVRRGLAAFELMWALALAAFGSQQATLLIGSLHWIIRVIHLLMAFSAVALGNALSKTILGAVPARTRQSGRETGPGRVS